MSESPMTDRDSRRGFLTRLGQASALAALGPLVPEASADALSPDRSAAPNGAVPPPASPLDEDGWKKIRGEFLPGGKTISINAANMCPAPKSVVEAVIRATRDVDTDVSYQNRAEYNQLRDKVRERIAKLINADGDEIAIVRNASEANNIVVGGLELERDDEVLLLDQNHPTNNVAWDVRAAQRGFQVRRIGFATAPTSQAEVLARFTAAVSPRTRVIAFSHVSNTTGLKVPASQLCRWARERGIYTHVDGAQTFAATPIDVRDIGCDSYSVSAQKWLMGPREIGFLFVRSNRLDRIWPGVIGVGWGDRKDPAVKGARKFETMGQRNDAATAGLMAALEFHEKIGPVAMAERIGVLTDRLVAGLRSHDIPLVTSTDPSLRLGVVVIQAEAARAARMHEKLYRDHGIIGSNTGGLRLSPNVCVTLAEIDRVVMAVTRVYRDV